MKGEAQAHLPSCREEREDKCGKEALNRTAAGGGAGNRAGPALQREARLPRAGSKKSEGGQPAVTQAGRVSLAPGSFPVITPLVITIAAAAVH